MRSEKAPIESHSNERSKSEVDLSEVEVPMENDVEMYSQPHSDNTSSDNEADYSVMVDKLSELDSDEE